MHRVLVVGISSALLGMMAPTFAETAPRDPGEAAPIHQAQNSDVPGPSERARPATSVLKSKAERVASQHGLDPDLVDAIIRAESAYDPHAISPAGAVGLMQVMPETAADYGIQTLEGLFEPDTNLSTGMRHLKRLLGKYGSIGAAVMAYNAGEATLERGNGFVTYPETQRYTHQVLSTYLERKGIAPYSDEAREVVGMVLTPAMARAGSGSRDRVEGDWGVSPDDDRWLPTIRRPELRPELRPDLRLQLSDKRLSSRLSASSARVAMPTMRTDRPTYRIQPGTPAIRDQR